MYIKIKTINEKIKIPTLGTTGSAGYDIRAFLKEPINIKPGETKLIPTGLFFEIEPGYEVQVRPRSGLSLKHSIMVLNSPGTIDSDYRGEIKVILHNLGKETFEVSNEMRIAQIVISKYEVANFISVEKLDKSERNENGFGHTGL